MATEEYVDAGSAIPYAALSMSAGKAPPVAKGVNRVRGNNRVRAGTPGAPSGEDGP